MLTGRPRTQFFTLNCWLFILIFVYQKKMLSLRLQKIEKMDVKKAISLSFLIIANAAILMHIVMFHHHNSALAAAFCVANQTHCCTENTQHHCTGNADRNNTCPSDENAHNDPCNKCANNCCTIENCLLNAFITKIDGFKLTEPAANSLNIFIHTIPTFLTHHINDLAGLPFRQKPYIPLFYTTFVSQSPGLRAPPVC